MVMRKLKLRKSSSPTFLVHFKAQSRDGGFGKEMY